MAGAAPGVGQREHMSSIATCCSCASRAPLVATVHVLSSQRRPVQPWVLPFGLCQGRALGPVLLPTRLCPPRRLTGQPSEFQMGSTYVSAMGASFGWGSVARRWMSHFSVPAWPSQGVSAFPPSQCIVSPCGCARPRGPMSAGKRIFRCYRASPSPALLAWAGG